jgi:hypothetical protein
MSANKCFIACTYDRTQPIVGFDTEVCVGFGVPFARIESPKAPVGGLVLRVRILRIDIKLREVAG